MITLVPISHVAKQSTKNVREAIETLKPKFVAVELCNERVSKRKPKKEKLSRRSLLAKVLVYFQEKYAKKVGTKAGNEMRTAMKEGRKVGATVILIDRPVSVTLDRLSKSISIWDLFRIVFDGLTGSEVPFDLNTVPSSAVVDELVEQLKDGFPKIYKVLITERDAYMAEQLKGKDSVVAVVGAGHVKGLLKRKDLGITVWKGEKK